MSQSAEYHQHDRKEIKATDQPGDPVQSQKGANEPEFGVQKPADPEAQERGKQTTEITFVGLKLGEALLVFVTGWLVLVTRRLVADTKNTSRMQLRAYMALDSSKVTEEGNTLIVTLKFINAGQTPAYGVHVISDTRVDHKSVRRLPRVRKGGETPDKRVIGPGRPYRYIKEIKVPPGEMNAVRKGDERRGFVWGRLKYRDAFGQRRYLKFTYRTALNECDCWIMQPTQGGEKAN